MAKMILAAFLLTSAAAQAAPLVYTPLYTLPAPPPGRAASSAQGPLIAAESQLFGVEGGDLPGNITAQGGVYSFSSSSGGSTLYTFANLEDGSEPIGNLLYLNGLLYGVTEIGGAYNQGTLYSVDPATGSHKILYSFNDSSFSSGFQPTAGLTFLNGLIYGTTNNGGSLNGSGTVYSFDPGSGAITFLHDFASNNTYPSALIAVGNTLYGTTLSGGAYGDGIIFATNTVTGVTQTLHSFAAGTDGSEPNGVVYLNGSLYGSASYGGYSGNSACRRSGCGVIFAYNLTSNLETILYSFKDKADGEHPGPLTVVNKTLIGATLPVFSLNPATGKFSILFTYDAEHPNTVYSLLYADHALYGASNGGITPGILYSLTQ